MGMIRGPGGIPQYVPSHKPPAAPDPPAPPAPGPGLPPNPAAAVPDTVPAADFHRPGPSGEGSGEDEHTHTRIHRPDPNPSSAPGLEADDDPMADPPAGWLVIVDGPGRGRAVTLGLHHNSIGRDAENRVALDYGDETISRRRHLVVTCDPEGRRFYVTPGDATNLSYLNDQPVLAPMPLEPSARIRTGRTTLRFVPLLGPDFSWDGAGAAAAGDGDV